MEDDHTQKHFLKDCWHATKGLSVASAGLAAIGLGAMCLGTVGFGWSFLPDFYAQAFSTVGIENPGFGNGTYLSIGLISAFFGGHVLNKGIKTFRTVERNSVKLGAAAMFLGYTTFELGAIFLGGKMLLGHAPVGLTLS